MHAHACACMFRLWHSVAHLLHRNWSAKLSLVVRYYLRCMRKRSALRCENVSAANTNGSLIWAFLRLWNEWFTVCDSQTVKFTVWFMGPRWGDSMSLTSSGQNCWHFESEVGSQWGRRGGPGRHFQHRILSWESQLGTPNYLTREFEVILTLWDVL
jgi:hypothetical protein